MVLTNDLAVQSVRVRLLDTLVGPKVRCLVRYFGGSQS